MTALERMSAEDARKCSQVLLRNLLAKYDTEGTRGLPLEAEALLSGLVSFGADLGTSHTSLSAMDSYFVNNWWSVLDPVLPHGLDSSQIEDAEGAGNGASSSTDPMVGQRPRGHAELSTGPSVNTRDPHRDGQPTALLKVKVETVDKSKHPQRVEVRGTGRLVP